MAQGKINDTHPSSTPVVGLIDRTDISDPAPYVFKIPEGLVDPTYQPVKGQSVTFTPGNGHTATAVQRDVL